MAPCEAAVKNKQYIVGQMVLFAIGKKGLEIPRLWPF